MCVLQVCSIWSRLQSWCWHTCSGRSFHLHQHWLQMHQIDHCYIVFSLNSLYLWAFFILNVSVCVCVLPLSKCSPLCSLKPSSCWTSADCRHRSWILKLLHVQGQRRAKGVKDKESATSWLDCGENKKHTISLSHNNKKQGKFCLSGWKLELLMLKCCQMLNRTFCYIETPPNTDKVQQAWVLSLWNCRTKPHKECGQATIYCLNKNGNRGLWSND